MTKTRLSIMLAAALAIGAASAWVDEPAMAAEPSLTETTGGPSAAQLLPPLPELVEMSDLPNDNGTGLVVTWTAPDTTVVPKSVFYRVAIGTSPDGPFYPAGEVNARLGLRASSNPAIFGWSPKNEGLQFLVVRSYLVPSAAPGGEPERVGIEPDRTYFAQFSVVSGGMEATLSNVLVCAPRQNWFMWTKLNLFVFLVFVGVVVLVFIELARRNPNMYIRKIAGLDAVEEAVGRATEMGKPVYFVHGLEPISNISTIAALNILGPVARQTFKYETELKVLNNDPIVLAVSQETVQQAALDVGRPDSYDEDKVMFVASNQFSYAAAVEGMMVRERPATVLLMGYFYAESLLFTETGGHIGAIQIAGTDAYTQLPFFITTCDYTLMGEELYAASAYLSREPKLLGSLRGQDLGKVVFLGILALGAILELVGVHWFTRLVTPL